MWFSSCLFHLKSQLLEVFWLQYPLCGTMRSLVCCLISSSLRPSRSTACWRRARGNDLSLFSSVPFFLAPQEYQKILEQQHQKQTNKGSIVIHSKNSDDNSEEISKREVVEWKQVVAEVDVNLPSFCAEEQGDPSGWVIGTTLARRLCSTDWWRDVMGYADAGVDFVIGSDDNDCWQLPINFNFMIAVKKLHERQIVQVKLAMN